MTEFNFHPLMSLQIALMGTTRLAEACEASQEDRAMAMDAVDKQFASLKMRIGFVETTEGLSETLQFILNLVDVLKTQDLPPAELYRLGLILESLFSSAMRDHASMVFGLEGLKSPKKQNS